MSNTFLKALGYDVQDSSVEDALIKDALELLKSAKRKKSQSLFTHRRCNH